MDSDSGPERPRATRERGRGEADGADRGNCVPRTLSTPVSPPPKRRRLEAAAAAAAAAKAGPETAAERSGGVAAAVDGDAEGSESLSRSPFQLTAIRDLPASANVDTVTVRDVFGSPRVVECWEFNFLHDIDFLVDAFDAGAWQRGLAVHVVHGFWKREDPRREALETAARRHRGGRAGVTLHAAFMPEPFGTHHTKMAVLLRDDGTAQVVIHTANMIAHDWENMTQAVWRSPLLPLRREGEEGGEEEEEEDGLQDGKDGAPGIGHRFKKDFLSYLRAYDEQRRTVCRPLVEKLSRYDFSAVRAVLVGSVPGRHHVPHPGEEAEHGSGHGARTQWGWAGMRRALQQVPIALRKVATPPGVAAAGAQPVGSEVVVQVSSIATLGGNDAWLRQTLFAALSGGKSPGAQTPGQQQRRESSFGPLRMQQQQQQQQPPKPQFRVVFPTADEIRRSLDGYVSGTSIHTKIQSVQQQRQLAYMRPIMCHWANDMPGGAALPAEAPQRDAGRRRAAPHVKTYVRYGRDGSIDWALLTSANLSKQAWGEARSMAGEMRIASYELGVLVWPELFAAGATMQPVFGRDTFGEAAASPLASTPASDTDDGKPVVPLRIPYSLPLQRYGEAEVPWVGSLPHDEPDWRGVRWQDRD